MKYFLFILIIFFSSVLFSLGNASLKMFSEVMLNNPKQFSKRFDEIFSYNEIGTFSRIPAKGKIIIENGYAKSRLLNPEDWTKIKTGKIVKEIDIVFTKYPRHRKNWIMNYDELLADRLKELFKTDPALNSPDIRWRLLLQTDCRNDKEARTFFHGIVIYAEETEKPVELKNSENKNSGNEARVAIIKNDLDSAKEEYNTGYRATHSEDDYYKENGFLYRPTPNSEKKGKRKKLKEPACPDFRKKKLRLF